MNHATKEELIVFENCVKLAWEEGDLPFLLHLAGGNEDQLIHVFQSVLPGDWILGSHRSHYHWLLSGGSPMQLLEKIHAGESMFLYSRALRFLTSSILAGNCCIAAGLALSIRQREGKEHVWCFLGDGAEDEGHFYEAVSFVQGHDLPCTFVIEDNDRSVDTSIAARRGDLPRRDWGPHVVRYTYAPTYPHAGSGCRHHITFKPRENPWKA